jgi:hypothetical protein
MAVGGDIQEIRFQHPTEGSGVLFAKSAEEAKYNLGGPRSNDDNNGVTASGEMIDQINNTRWSFENTCAWDMNTRDDVDKVSRMAESPLLADWTITHINGAVHGGKGKPVGDIEGDGNAATFPLKLAGGGKLKKIAG